MKTFVLMSWRNSSAATEWRGISPKGDYQRKNPTIQSLRSCHGGVYSKFTHLRHITICSCEDFCSYVLWGAHELEKSVRRAWKSIKRIEMTNAYLSIKHPQSFCGFFVSPSAKWCHFAAFFSHKFQVRTFSKKIYLKIKRLRARWGLSFFGGTRHL